MTKKPGEDDIAGINTDDNKVNIAQLYSLLVTQRKRQNNWEMKTKPTLNEALLQE